MLVAVCIVAVSYVLPFAAMWMTGLKPTAWETGSWADIAGLLGGPLLRIGVVLGGMISAFGMFNALVMSYSRLPLAMAQDGMLPGIFGKLQKKSRAPWVAILALATGWAMCLGLGFARLVTIDILLYGVSLLLEFMALAVLRFREPELTRPFRVPGGLFGAIAIGIPPMLLLGFSVVRSEHEQIWNMSSFAFGMILIAAGFVVYFINHALKPAGWTAPARKQTAARSLIESEVRKRRTGNFPVLFRVWFMWGQPPSAVRWAKPSKDRGNRRAASTDSRWRLSPQSALNLRCGFRRIAQHSYFVMSALDGGGLTAHHLGDIFRQIAGHRLLVRFFGSVFARLHRLENRLVAPAKSDLGIKPGAMHRPTRRPGHFLVGLAQTHELGFEFSDKARPLQALLVEIGLEVGAFHVLRRVLIALLSVFVGFNKIFKHTDSIVFVHNSLRDLVCSLDARMRSGFGGILRARELGRKVAVL